MSHLAFRARYFGVLLTGGAIALSVLGLLPAARVESRSQSQASNPIIVENQQPGTSLWRMYQNGRIPATDVGGQIKGYASAVSVNKGSSIDFKVSVNTAQTFSINVYRMGYYGGTGGRLMQTVGSLSGTPQPACPQDVNTGMVICNWATNYTLNVPTNWTSGIYLAQLTNAQNYQNYIVFVVRDDARIADFVYQQPVLTYQAYNNYPGESYGKSIYEYNSSAALTAAGTGRAVKVSFDRPYSRNGDGLFLSESVNAEMPLVRWLEKTGYDVTYATNLDTHVNGAGLTQYKGFISGGHDEYWTKEMYDAVEAARNAGVHLAFIGGNDVYWQVRMEPSGGGTPNRIVTCYKNSAIDPITTTQFKTVRWRDISRAEQQLIGVQYTTYYWDNSLNTAFVAKNTSHWLYNGSGLSENSTVPGMIGYEVDRLHSEFAAPPQIGYTLVATSPYTGSLGLDLAHTSIYQAPSGAWVFGAGTVSWGLALDTAGIANAGIQKMTQNLLDVFKQGQVTPPTATSTPVGIVSPTPTPTSNALTNIALSGTAYRWYEMASSLTNAPRATLPLLNDNNLINETRLNPNGVDIANGWEGAGVVWGTNQSVREVRFMNGLRDSFSDGVFVANFKLQFSADGSTWVDDSGWVSTPAYPYDSVSASGATFTFAGTETQVRGVRVVGQVRIDPPYSSYFVNARELQAFSLTQGSTATATATSAPTNTPTPTATGAPPNTATATSAPTNTATPTATGVPPNTATATSTPAVTTVLDDFNRANGGLGNNWLACDATRCQIQNNRLSFTASAETYWKTVFGGDQWASVRLVNALTNGQQLGLHLKVFDDYYYPNGVIEVNYTQGTGVRVYTFDNPNWPGFGSVVPMTLAPNDVFKATARTNGLISIYKNDVLVTTVTIAASWNIARAGQIGVWTDSAMTLDDFDGGTLSVGGATATPVPTTAPSATATSAAATSTQTPTPVVPSATATPVPTTAPSATATSAAATSTQTPTPVVPSATPTSAAATATALPSATATPVPTTAPSATPTSVAATATPGSVNAKINFQPASAAVPAGYSVDSGLVYAARGNGYTYGWNANNTANTRDRNATRSPDQRFDTFILTQNGGSFVWEMAVPNGTYSVRMVAGDANLTSGKLRYNAESSLVVSGTVSTNTRWFTGTANITVNDGRLTISNASGASGNRLCFIEIRSGANTLGAATSNVLASADMAGETTNQNNESRYAVMDLKLNRLMNFTAVRSRAGIQLSWRDGLVRLRGFRIYRSVTGDRTDAVEITPGMVHAPAAGDAPIIFVDAGVDAMTMYHYWLHLVGEDGQEIEVGSIHQTLVLADGERNRIFYLPLMMR